MGNTNCGCSRKVGGKRVKRISITKKEVVDVIKNIALIKSQKVKKEGATIAVVNLCLVVTSMTVVQVWKL